MNKKSYPSNDQKSEPLIIRKNEQRAKDRRDKIEDRKRKHKQFLLERVRKESKNESSKKK